MFSMIENSIKLINLSFIFPANSHSCTLLNWRGAIKLISQLQFQMRKTQWWLFSFIHVFICSNCTKKCFLFVWYQTLKKNWAENITIDGRGIVFVVFFSRNSPIQWHRAVFTQFLQFLLFLFYPLLLPFEVFSCIFMNIKLHRTANQIYVLKYPCDDDFRFVVNVPNENKQRIF